MVGPTLNAPKPPTATIKFLFSYGGRILPRYPDGKLRYNGGHTRVLAVVRSISFSELMTKLGELCGKTVNLRCQLPTQDLDALVTITSDEDLMNLIQEYDPIPCPQSSSLKIRAFLSAPKKSYPSPPLSPTPSPILTKSTASGSAASSGSGSSTVTPKSPGSYPVEKFPVAGVMAVNRCVYTPAKPPLNVPLSYNETGGKMPYHAYRNLNQIYLVQNGNHWQ